MIKKIAIVLLFAGLALAAWQAAGPLLTLRMIEQDLAQKNSTRLAQNIDFPQLRNNVTLQVDQYLKQIAEQKLKDNPFGMMTALFASQVFRVTVDQLVTPDSIMSLLQGQSLTLAGVTGSWAQAKPEAEAEVEAKTEAKAQPCAAEQTTTSYSYDTINQFSMTVLNQVNTKTSFILNRAGLGWQLTNIIMSLQQ